jgi:NADH-quinone oxidoreductase subunit C
MRYEDAVESLFQAPHEQFVTERKRLAGELKAAGDKTGAGKLAKLVRPPISAWVVDQLWWRSRDAFEALFATAEQLRLGEPGATAAHRDALAGLRAQAAQLLGEAGHAANEATLRRVTQTLSALAAAGGWAPDLPGALSADRDPPGFEAVGITNVIPFPVQPRAPAAAHHGAHDAGDAEAAAERHRREREADEARLRREREAAATRAESAADLRRAEAERARAAAERHRLEAALRTARGDVAQREREVVKLERDLASARNLVEQARQVVLGLEDRLAQLDN